MERFTVIRQLKFIPKRIIINAVPFFLGKYKVVSGIRNGTCFVDTENPEEYEIKKLGLDCEFISGLKEHHYCIFGLLMQLKSSGLVLNKKAEINKFQGQDCFALRFSYDSTHLVNNYFKTNDWTVYIDQNNYLLKGYSMKGALNWTATISGFFTVNGIKVPITRVNYNTVDNSLHSAELIMLPE